MLAVIPAPIAYIKVVAVKKLVVGFLLGVIGRPRKGSAPVSSLAILGEGASCINLRVANSPSFTVKKLECLKQAYALNTLAWNNEIGPWSILLVSRLR
nr:hypothetical protein [Virgibacillus profundi]